MICSKICAQWQIDCASVPTSPNDTLFALNTTTFVTSVFEVVIVKLDTVSVDKSPTIFDSVTEPSAIIFDVTELFMSLSVPIVFAPKFSAAAVASFEAYHLTINYRISTYTLRSKFSSSILLSSTPILANFCWSLTTTNMLFVPV